MQSMASTVLYESDLLERVIVPEDPDLPPEAAQWFLSLSFQKKDLRRMKQLAAKARAGSLSVLEAEELRGFERIGSFLGLLQSKARISLGKRARRT